MAGRVKTDEPTRFWEKVDVRGPDECWPWLAGTHRGYGTFGFRGEKRQAQRVAWWLAKGAIPNGYDVDHLCETPLCCNPQHLEPVTHSENMRRMWAKRKARLGSKAGMNCGVKMSVNYFGSAARYAKLTAEQAAAIRADKRPAPVIAAEYGVGRTTVYHIRQGRRYAKEGAH